MGCLCMEKKVFLGLLLDFYGQMLTDHQRNLMELYCQEDYSLSEIAQLQDISRQGVYDTLSRAEKQLMEMEEQLHLAFRYTRLQQGLREMQTELQQSGLDEYATRIDALLKEWESP